MDGRTEKDIITERSLKIKLDSAPDYIQDWFYYLKASDKTAKTCRNYINKVLLFLKFINPDISQIKPEDITQSKVNRYMAEYEFKNVDGEMVEYVDSTKLGNWFSLNSFFSYMVINNYYTVNFMDNIKKPKNNDEIRISENRILLSENELNRILNSVLRGAGNYHAKKCQEKMKTRDYAIMFLFMVTGMREGALTEINISDIDFDKQVLLTRDKGKKRHKYQLNDKTMGILKEWMVYRNIILYNKGQLTDALFISNQGKRISERAVFNIVGKYSESALGYRISPHKLRGSFIHIMLEKENGNAEKVKKMVGHSSIAITQRYNDKHNGEQKEAIDTMCSLIG